MKDEYQLKEQVSEGEVITPENWVILGAAEQQMKLFKVKELDEAAYQSAALERIVAWFLFLILGMVTVVFAMEGFGLTKPLELPSFEAKSSHLYFFVVHISREIFSRLVALDAFTLVVVSGAIGVFSFIFTAYHQAFSSRRTLVKGFLRTILFAGLVVCIGFAGVVCYYASSQHLESYTYYIVGAAAVTGAFVLFCLQSILGKLERALIGDLALKKTPKIGADGILRMEQRLPCGNGVQTFEYAMKPRKEDKKLVEQLKEPGLWSALVASVILGISFAALILFQVEFVFLGPIMSMNFIAESFRAIFWAFAKNLGASGFTAIYISVPTFFSIWAFLAASRVVALSIGTMVGEILGNSSLLGAMASVVARIFSFEGVKILQSTLLPTCTIIGALFMAIVDFFWELPWVLQEKDKPKQIIQAVSKGLLKAVYLVFAVFSNLLVLDGMWDWFKIGLLDKEVASVISIDDYLKETPSSSSVFWTPFWIILLAMGFLLLAFVAYNFLKERLPEKYRLEKYWGKIDPNILNYTLKTRTILAMLGASAFFIPIMTSTLSIIEQIKGERIKTLFNSRLVERIGTAPPPYGAIQQGYGLSYSQLQEMPPPYGVVVPQGCFVPQGPPPSYEEATQQGYGAPYPMLQQASSPPYPVPQRPLTNYGEVTQVEYNTPYHTSQQASSPPYPVPQRPLTNYGEVTQVEYNTPYPMSQQASHPMPLSYIPHPTREDPRTEVVNAKKSQKRSRSKGWANSPIGHGTSRQSENNAKVRGSQQHKVTMGGYRQRA